MLINKDSLKTHLYPEIVDVITRQDAVLVKRFIDAGIGQVKSYLNRFDAATMFATGFEDEYFLQLCVDVISWKLCKLANPNIDMALFRTNYEDAIKDLEKVQKGLTAPAWPARPNDPETPQNESVNLQWSSNPKRNNYF